MRSVGWALIQHDRGPYYKEEFAHSHAQMEDGVRQHRETPRADAGREQDGACAGRGMPRAPAQQQGLGERPGVDPPS